MFTLKKQTTVSFSEELYDEMEKESKKTGLSLSSVVELKVRGFKVEKGSEKLIADEVGILFDVIDRAKDIWGLDYATASEGYSPLGNQIGRRGLCSEDLGLKEWKFKTGADPTFYYELDEDCFIIFHGARVREEYYNDINGFQLSLSGIVMPYCTVSGWEKEDGWYSIEFKNPVAVSPKSSVKFNIMSPCPDKEVVLELIGEVVGKRCYIILPPEKLLSNAELRAELDRRRMHGGK